MRAVADTGPLNYLVLIAWIDLVPRLYGSLSISTVVRDELDDPMTPAVRQWIAAPPGWLSIMPAPAGRDPVLASLGHYCHRARVDLIQIRLELVDSS